MNRTLIAALTAGVGAAMVLTSGVVLIATQQPAASIFTTEQADAGRAAYAKHCASCHMPDLGGDNEKPPLAGAAFMTTWGGKSTKELLKYMSGAMPYNAPALEAESYRSIIAFILRSNGATAGTQAFSSDTDVPIVSVTSAPANGTAK